MWHCFSSTMYWYFNWRCFGGSFIEVSFKSSIGFVANVINYLLIYAFVADILQNYEKWLLNSYLTVLSRGTTWFPLDRFLCNHIFKNISKICRETVLSFTKILQVLTGSLLEDLCTFTIISCWIIFKMRNVLDKFIEKTKAHIFCSVTVFRKSCSLWDQAKIFGRDGEATDDNTAHAPCTLNDYCCRRTDYVILLFYVYAQYSYLYTNIRYIASDVVPVHCRSVWVFCLKHKTYFHKIRDVCFHNV
jgi:hypothetical protein